MSELGDIFKACRQEMMARRGRRVDRVNDKFDELQRRCHERNVKVTRHSNQHWQFQLVGPLHGEIRQVADWWPSSGKFVFNKDWKNAKKATSTTGALHLIQRAWL